MFRQKTLSSYQLVWLLIAASLVGVGLSIYLTTDSRWTEWHISRLGEGGHISSLVFNASLVFCALIMMRTAQRIVEETSTRLQSSPFLKLRIALLAAAFCWVGVASFPFDQHPIIHNVFGYGFFLVVVSALISLGRTGAGVSRRTIVFGYVAIAVTTLLMTAFHTLRFGTLLMVELIGQVFFYAWLLSLTRDIGTRKSWLTKNLRRFTSRDR